ncbi:hypothetical protein Agub_g11809 [Astrephomene gubernaculifera]|uniref:RING-type domain-containing protein n=1 Tax=Astrephomene gubernaculifera TaxID=47775 RepID=A0AAD3DX18_9CHLO|nr:hypothetical protein Agub_g11809 [Astrephomene gubernaculifera]
MRVQCSICYERTGDLGELDSCLHRFCFPCISRWADTENRCPLCKERFIVITHKRLLQGRGRGQQQQQGQQGQAGRKRTREEAAASEAGADAGAEAAGEAAAGSGSDASDDPDAGEGPRKRLKGVVLETRLVEDRKQRWQPAELLGLDLEALRCQAATGATTPTAWSWRTFPRASGTAPSVSSSGHCWRPQRGGSGGCSSRGSRGRVVGAGAAVGVEVQQGGAAQQRRRRKRQRIPRIPM